MICNSKYNFIKSSFWPAVGLPLSSRFFYTLAPLTHSSKKGLKGTEWLEDSAIVKDEKEVKEIKEKIKIILKGSVNFLVLRIENTL